MTTVHICDLLEFAGADLGCSDWFRITQPEVDTFADLVGDRSWIHRDREEARNSPYGGPIVPGYLLLSFVSALLADAFEVTDAVGVNYGINRVRFIAPVPVGSRVRLRAQLVSVDDRAGGLQASLAVTFEFDEPGRYCAVAEIVWLYRHNGSEAAVR